MSGLGESAAGERAPVRPGAATRLRWASRIWLAAVVVGFGALTLTSGLPRDPEGDGMITGLGVPLQVALLTLAALGWLLSWRQELTSALLLATGAGLLAVLGTLGYHPLISPLVAAAFLLPAVGFWLAWQHRRRLRTAAAAAVVAALLAGAGWAGGALVYDHFYGPAHPVSTTPALPVDRVVWSWSGGVTTGAVTVVAQLVPGARQARLVLHGPDGELVTTGPAAADRHRVVRLVAGALAPDTAYTYAIEVDGRVDTARGVGRFRTMPAGPATFTVAVGGCARTGSNGAVFDAIADLDPLLYLVTGDLHYGNPDRDDLQLFDALYRQVLTAPAQAALYRTVPVAYVWDDHDYGPDNADATSPARRAARAAYASHVPHYPLPDGPGGAIYQAFSAGRVRFVITDSRSARTDESMLGARQLAWLERELVHASRSHALVVWVNPVPWVAQPRPGADHWGGYPAERQRIADVIADHGIRNLVMLSGDAHMVAIDDGSHTDYRTPAPDGTAARGGEAGLDAAGAGGAGFPLLHAAALDRPGSVKGGPYSEGAYPGPGQFGTLTVRDEGGPTVQVELAGWNWRGERVVSYQTALPVPEPVRATQSGR